MRTGEVIFTIAINGSGKNLVLPLPFGAIKSLLRKNKLLVQATFSIPKSLYTCLPKGFKLTNMNIIA